MSIVRAASQQAQLVHKAEVQAVQTEEVSADELWSFVLKTEAMPAPRARSGRGLDCNQFSGFK